MAFSSTSSAKQAMSLLVCTAVFFVILSGIPGAKGAKLNFTLPSNLPASLTNFTGGTNFKHFLVNLFLGVGVQEYTYNGTTWINSNVSAILFDENEIEVAHHFFLPPPGVNGAIATWAATDGSNRVSAAVVVRIAQEAAVPLLLLDAKFTAGKKGRRTNFEEVTNVQRLETRNGLPPSYNGTVGEIFLSGYSALYAFYDVC